MFEQHHVIIISLDTLRPDYLGFYGHPWVETPNLDALAAESIVLEDCSAPAPTTMASHTSLFTGLYPHRHGVPRNGFVVHEDNVMLAEILADAEYHTAGFVGSFALSSRLNFDQGFDYFDEYPQGSGFATPARAEDRRVRERMAEDVTNAVKSYLSERFDDSEPLFLFVHYFDAHAPYNAPPPYSKMYSEPFPPQTAERPLQVVRNRLPHLSGEAGFGDVDQLINRYAAQISYLDTQIGELLEWLRSKDILDNSILLITSDHGESLWDHPPFFERGPTVFQDTIRAVGLIRLPGAYRAGTRISEPTTTLDLFPTLLDFLDIEPPQELHGTTLALDRSGAKPAPLSVR